MEQVKNSTASTNQAPAPAPLPAPAYPPPPPLPARSNPCPPTARPTHEDWDDNDSLDSIPVRAPPPQRAPFPSNDRNIHLPKFNGRANVDGYFAMFERLIAGLTLDEENQARYLISKLEGPAQQWLLGQGDKWTTWTYSELKAELTKHFRGESTVHQRKLLPAVPHMQRPGQVPGRIYGGCSCSNASNGRTLGEGVVSLYCSAARTCAVPACTRE